MQLTDFLEKKQNDAHLANQKYAHNADAANAKIQCKWVVSTINIQQKKGIKQS